ncbi:hypothetical protein [Oscillibacter sp.]|uniref:hypothetical protein n=1 Tax=Oscillibacter sp. TaxID=1945593 RepID=UPI0033967EC2
MANDKNRNYAQEIKDAIASGADQSVVNDLNSQRNEKIAANQDYYASKGISSDDGYAADAYLYGQKLSSSGSSGNAGGSYNKGAPSYTSKYADQINALTQQILNSSYGGFKTGDEYAALQQSYTKNGQKAMQDTLGQISARTGGLASSYAGSASQQSYNNYMDTLEQAALEMYQDKLSGDRSNLSMLSGLESGDYAKYADQLSQWNADRSFSYGVESDNRNFNYQAGRDAVSDNHYDQEYADSRSDYGDSRGDVEYQKQAAAADNLAQYGDFSGYKALGYTDSQIAAMKKQWQVEQAMSAAKTTKKTSTKSSAGYGGGSQNYDGLFASAQSAVSPQNFISSNYKKYGFSSASGLWSAYQKWAGNGADATSLNYNEDEGVFKWNGKQYSSAEKLASAIEKAGLTSSQKQALSKKFSLYGFDISFN